MKILSKEELSQVQGGIPVMVIIVVIPGPMDEEIARRTKGWAFEGFGDYIKQ